MPAGLGMEVLQWGPEKQFADFDCRNDQSLKILHNSSSILDQYVSQSEEGYVTFWVSASPDPCLQAPPLFGLLSAQV